MKHVKLFEAFVASKKVNEDTDWDACEGAQKAKWGPVCKMLKCDYDDLVFFELIHNELDEYTEEEYDYAAEKDETLDFNTKKYKLDTIGDGDPHGRCDGAVVAIKGTKLKYAWFDAPDMRYSGTIASINDLQALEDFYLDGYEGTRSKAIQYATPMSDVYDEYCSDMGFEN